MTERQPTLQEFANNDQDDEAQDSVHEEDPEYAFDENGQRSNNQDKYYDEEEAEEYADEETNREEDLGCDDDVALEEPEAEEPEEERGDDFAKYVAVGNPQHQLMISRYDRSQRRERLNFPYSLRIGRFGRKSGVKAPQIH